MELRLGFFFLSKLSLQIVIEKKSIKKSIKENQGGGGIPSTISGTSLLLSYTVSIRSVGKPPPPPNNRFFLLNRVESPAFSVRIDTVFLLITGS